MDILLLVAVFVASSAATALAVWGDDERTRVRSRLQDLVGALADAASVPAEKAGKAGMKRGASGWRPPFLERAALLRLDLRLRPWRPWRSLAGQLQRAGLNLQASEFMVLVAFLGILGTAVPVMTGGSAGTGLVTGGASVWLPFLWLRWRQSCRLRVFEQQLPDALSMLAASLRAGSSLLQAMGLVERELPPPISLEFRRVVGEIRVNVPFERALENLQQRVGSPDLELAVTSVIIQREVGGNLAEILDGITTTIRERVRIRGEVRVLTAQGRFSGWIISLLPGVLGLVIYTMNPAYIAPLFSHPLGRFMVGAAAALQFTGFIVINRIMSIDF